MNSTAIRVEGLSKRYRIGVHADDTNTVVGAVNGFLRAPFKNLQRLRSLSRFSEDGSEQEDVIWALKDVSFDVAEGEVVGIIGRNGAGKSTLLKILARITEPTRGTIEVAGTVSSLLEVGTGFHNELSGRDNIYLNGSILGMRKAEIDRKFDEIVDFSGVEQFIDTPVKRYSSGMTLRLAFAVAAHLDPQIMLVDEVLAVGDYEFQRKCLDKMQDVTREGRTVLFVSHNLTAIESLCHRAIHLEHGAIEFTGSPAVTIEHYLGQYASPPKSYTDLTDHPGRLTKSKPIFQNIRILDHREEETALIHVGDGLIFEMVLEGMERRLQSPQLLVVILDSHERTVCRFHTDYMTTEPFEILESNLVRCHWDSCRLAPGTYRVDIHLREHGTRFDEIWKATGFEVLPTDSSGTGKFDPSPGVFVPEGHWEFESRDPQVSSRTREPG